jgi:hypothetical protein
VTASSKLHFDDQGIIYAACACFAGHQLHCSSVPALHAGRGSFLDASELALMINHGFDRDSFLVCHCRGHCIQPEREMRELVRSMSVINACATFLSQVAVMTRPAAPLRELFLPGMLKAMEVRRRFIVFVRSTCDSWDGLAVPSVCRSECSALLLPHAGPHSDRQLDSEIPASAVQAPAQIRYRP